MDTQLLNHKFSEKNFVAITEHLLQRSITKEASEITVPSSSKYITHIKNLGRYDDLGLQLLVIKHSSKKDARIGLSRDIFTTMKHYSLNNAIAATHGDTDSWRYSLITAKFNISDSGNVEREFSNPKRHSYMLGPGAKVNTPYQYLIKKGKVKDFNDLNQRFSVEVVNDIFYKKIALLYDELVGSDSEQGLLIHPGEQGVKSEFAVRLLGRIIFCWFLKEKRGDNGASLIPQSILSLQAIESPYYYHKILAPLFFEILNKPQTARKANFYLEDMYFVPYLNGGLFEPGEDDYYEFSYDKKESVNNHVDVPNKWFKKLFKLLEEYNFTIDENTIHDADLSIDPEMLGRIFENLLARINPERGKSLRKKTGSFYTPREVVEYMVDESLKQYLMHQQVISEKKIEALISHDLLDDLQYPLTDKEKECVVDALTQIKILDPACGSGAFPIGLMQKIIFILQQVDPESRMWLDKQLLKMAPELQSVIKKEISNKNFDYVRKLGVIRNGIYGVDIQPIATEISRLRCFLTLVVDQSIDDNEPNRGIVTLPNLDFQFITANSLVNSSDLVKTQTAIYEDKEKLYINRMAEVIEEYFNASGEKRKNLQTEFRQIQQQMVYDSFTYHVS